MNRAGFFLVLSGGLLFPATAHAGMPQPFTYLTDSAQWRIQNVSFFLLGFCLCTWGVQLLWNSLRRDFIYLPRLSYFKAMGLVTLWGLLFTLILTMISGARELMTPGAWRPKGITYELVEEERDARRRHQLERLKVALWSYAKAHQGRFPQGRTDPEISPERWHLSDKSSLQYLYKPVEPSVFDVVPLAWEPDVFGDRRFVLFNDGRIEKMTSADLNRALSQEVQ